MEKTMKIEGMMCGHCEATVKKSLEALEWDYASGSMGLKDFLPQWDEESYQRQLEEKVRQIYDTYHIPEQELHTNNQNAGVEDGENAEFR